MHNYFWNLEWTGIGDYLVKLPAIDYYTLDLESNLYFDFTDNPRLECLIPKRKNIFIGKHNQPQNIIVNHHTNISNHASCFWLPSIKKFEANWLNQKEGFVYPYLPIDLNLRNHLLNKLNLKNKRFISLNKISSALSRNWTEEGWEFLIKTLHKYEYTLINIGSKSSSKNSIPYISNENVIDVDDFDLNLNEIGHIISASEASISLNTGSLHLATAFQVKNIIVISNMTQSDHKHWMYPNTKQLDREEPKELIINKILEFLA